MVLTMIMKKDIDHAVVINGKKCIGYKGKSYKPVERFFNSAEAIQYAQENRYSLIVSITTREPKCWLIMEEVKHE